MIKVKDGKHLKQIIESRPNDADLNDLDISNVTDMDNMFANSKFNGDISRWNVSKVEYMNNMFNGSQFNGDISDWNVSKVEYMNNMFNGSKLGEVYHYVLFRERYTKKQLFEGIFK